MLKICLGERAISGAEAVWKPIRVPARSHVIRDRILLWQLEKKGGSDTIDQAEFYGVLVHPLFYPLVSLISLIQIHTAFCRTLYRESLHSSVVVLVSWWTLIRLVAAHLAPAMQCKYPTTFPAASLATHPGSVCVGTPEAVTSVRGPKLVLSSYFINHNHR